MVRHKFAAIVIPALILGSLVLGGVGSPTAATGAIPSSGRSDHDRDDAGVRVRRRINHLLDLADAARARGNSRLANRLVQKAKTLECNFFGCPPATGKVTITMDPTAAGGFVSMPWPGDTRRRADGTIDLTGFPGRDVSPALDLVLARGEQVTKGFGTNSPVYFQTTGPLDPASLPTADESVGRRSTAMLLDLDDRAAPPVPLLADYKEPATQLRPANLIALLPYPGHPLTQGHRFAAVVFDGLVDTAGLALAPSPLVRELDGPPRAGVSPAVWSQLRAERDEMTAAVRARTRWHPSEVVAFTVFTTQEITAELEAIAAGVAALPPPVPVSRTIGDCGTGEGQTVVSGELDLPKWQAGPYPYLSGGGGIVIGPGGRAVRQGTERAVFEMAVPCAPAPRDGWPILLFMDGTGGFAHAGYILELGNNFGDAPLPYVVLSIAPLYSGDRSVPGQSAELLYFNATNPLAARTNQLQQAADMLYLKRIAQRLELNDSEGVAGSAPEIDDDTVVLAGHSQGAITLPHVLAVDPSIDAAFLSSGGAGFYHALLHRFDIRNLVVEPQLPDEPGELDMFHPTIQALQTIAEIGDAANYAPLVKSADIALYAGWIDGCSPIETNVHLATALGIEIANPVASPAFGTARFEPPIAELPVAGNLLRRARRSDDDRDDRDRGANRESGRARRRTGVMVELDQGHFGASDVPSIGRSFVTSIAEGRPATVDPGVLDPGFPTPGCLGRADPPPGG